MIEFRLVDFTTANECARPGVFAICDSLPHFCLVSGLPLIDMCRAIAHAGKASHDHD